jgi:hypothetical protein
MPNAGQRQLCEAWPPVIGGCGKLFAIILERRQSLRLSGLKWPPEFRTT